MRRSVVVCALLSGCAVGPDYSRPPVDSPAAYRIDYPSAADVANTKWWEQFGTQIGERAYLWAGDSSGRVTIGEHCRFGPEAFVTASDYGMLPDEKIAHQPRNERDIVIGNDVWLGARVFVGAGVTIGDGCVVSANSVVTRSLPPNSVAVGIPARIVRRREDYASEPEEAVPAGQRGGEHSG